MDDLTWCGTASNSEQQRGEQLLELHLFQVDHRWQKEPFQKSAEHGFSFGYGAQGVRWERFFVRLRYPGVRLERFFVPMWCGVTSGRLERFFVPMWCGVTSGRLERFFVLFGPLGSDRNEKAFLEGGGERGAVRARTCGP
jgi:hypothetical protein